MGVFSGFEWDAQKARANLRKHGVDFAGAAAVFEDEETLFGPAGHGSGTIPGARSMKRRIRSVDFSKGRRGAVVPVPAGKTRITIRIDTDILDWFREQVDAAGGGNYQTLMNQALRRYVEQGENRLEETLRRVVREELDRSRRGSTR
jgi:uncharacterized protein (DUF4415 family)